MLPPKPPVLTAAVWQPAFARWRFTFDKPIGTAPTPPLDGNFHFFRAFLPRAGYTMTLAPGGRLRFTGGTLNGGEDLVQYDGGPPDILSVDGGVLQPFSSVLPFP